jgi:hypothetical protein
MEQISGEASIYDSTQDESEEDLETIETLQKT